MRRARSALAGAVIGIVVVAAVAWNSVSAVPPGGSPPPMPPLPMSWVANSVAYLRAEYKVSQSEALRRLNMQGRAAGINAELAKDYPAVYGGLWIDQQDGGYLRIGATKPSMLAKAIAKLPDASHITLVTVKYSLVQLNVLRAGLTAKINGSSKVAEVVTDPVLNRVVVYQRAGAAAAGKGVRTSSARKSAESAVVVPNARVRALVAAARGEAVVRQLVVGAPKSGPTGRLAATATCSATACPPPLRGGFRLDIERTIANNDPDNENPLWGECTNGFNVIDTAGNAYLMTAGHCMVGSDKNGINRTFDNAGDQISTEDPDLESAASAYPVDYSIQPVFSSSTWQPTGQVLDFCWPKVQTWSSCTTINVRVNGPANYANVVVGAVLCATGSGSNDADGYKSSGSVPGTRCGEITGTNGGIVTNICSRKGDSGGPLFSEVSRQAYGILNDGTAGSGACPTSPPGTEWSQYSPVSKILTAVGPGYGLR